jgi:hypothetical protein
VSFVLNSRVGLLDTEVALISAIHKPSEEKNPRLQFTYYCCLNPLLMALLGPIASKFWDISSDLVLEVAAPQSYLDIFLNIFLVTTTVAQPKHGA